MDTATPHDALFSAIDHLDWQGVGEALRAGASARTPRGPFAERHDAQTPLAALWSAWPRKPGAAGAEAAAGILALLLDAGAFGTGRGVSGNPILIEAVDNAPDEAMPAIVRALCSHGASPDEPDANGAPPLTHAAERGMARTVSSLLDAGATPDGFDRTGRTALMRALEEGHAASAELLLERGSDPDATDVDGATAMLRLARGPTPRESLELLLRFHADPNLPDRDGRRPILECSSRGDLEALDVLLRGGADARCADRQGTTALMEAARAGRLPLEPEHLEALVSRLVQARAAADAIDANGQSAWDRLLSHHRTDLLDAWKEGLASGWVEQLPRLDETPARRLASPS